MTARTTLTTCLTMASILAAGIGANSVAHAAGPPVVGPAPTNYCGGQNAAPQAVPYSCDTKVKLIDGTPIWAHVVADGTRVTVTYHLLEPRTIPTPVRMVHHEGISGGGGASDTGSGIIPAGALTITVFDSSPCREGQLDIKAVDVGNGEDSGRVGGPWIRNGTDCSTTPTTAPTSPAPTTTVPGTTPPPTTSPTSAGAGTRLPTVGSSPAPLLWGGVLLLLVGALAVFVGRRPAS